MKSLLWGSPVFLPLEFFCQRYPMGPWMRWVNFPAMLLGLFLAPYLPEACTAVGI